ncbi:MAG: SGNH/GDSL hydrolase family protein [Candidatus Wallbacteria bacterium]|nr:SGNH/GDSL hydrolase family protein [Candidatus Wallbacteria bacterium]
MPEQTDLRPAPRPALALAAGLLTMGVSLLASWAILEAAIRVLGLAQPWVYRYDSAVGSHPRESIEFVWTKENRAVVRLNSHGFHEREVPLKKPAGEVRVAVLGDSFVEALQVAPEQSSTRLLEMLLRAQGHPAATVLAFGVSAFGTAQESLLLPEVMQYEPDLVLLYFTLVNDVRNNSFRLEAMRRRPFYRQKASGLELIPTPELSMLEKWSQPLEHSAAFRLLTERWTLIRRRLFEQGIATAPPHDVDCDVFLEPPDADWQDAWEVTGRVLAQMSASLAAKGVPFVVVVVPPWPLLYPEAWSEQLARENFKPANAYDLGMPERRLAAICGELSVPLVSPTEALVRESHRGSEPVCFAKIGHWTPAGHRVAAPAIAERLAALGLPRRHR